MEKIQVVYVAHEYPARTQTFVQREAEALAELEAFVRLYPLHSKSGRRLIDVPGRTPVKQSLRLKDVVRVLRRCVRLSPSIAAATLHPPMSLKNFGRQAMALFHGARLAYLLYEDRMDTPLVLHAHFLARTLEVANIAALLLADRRDIVMGATAHAADASHPESSQRLTYLVQRLDYVVAASRSVGAALERVSGRSIDAIVHCGVARSDVTPRDTLSGAPLKVLSVGRLVDKKGYTDCITAASLLNKAGISVEWRVVGDGPLADELLWLSSATGQEFVWLGYQPTDRITELLSNWADLFVLAARPAADGDLDGIPVALMEAMAAGVPVVSTNLSGIPELVRPRTTGHLVPPGAPVELAATIGRATSHYGEFSSLARNAVAYVASDFNVDLEAAKLFQVMTGRSSSVRITKR